MTSDEIVGVSASLLDGDWDWPVHGLRHPPDKGTSGWYVWTGEWSDADDFFKPLHTAHLIERCPEISKFLGLPPGSRFLIAPGYEDTWTPTSHCSMHDPRTRTGAAKPGRSVFPRMFPKTERDPRKGPGPAVSLWAILGLNQ